MDGPKDRESTQNRMTSSELLILCYGYGLSESQITVSNKEKLKPALCRKLLGNSSTDFTVVGNPLLLDHNGSCMWFLNIWCNSAFENLDEYHAPGLRMNQHLVQDTCMWWDSWHDEVCLYVDAVLSDDRITFIPITRCVVRYINGGLDKMVD